MKHKIDWKKVVVLLFILWYAGLFVWGVFLDIRLFLYCSAPLVGVFLWCTGELLLIEEDDE